MLSSAISYKDSVTGESSLRSFFKKCDRLFAPPIPADAFSSALLKLNLIFLVGESTEILLVRLAKSSSSLCIIFRKMTLID